MRVFFLIWPTMKFSKPFKTFPEQIEILESRGLSFDDKIQAERSGWRLSPLWV